MKSSLQKLLLIAASAVIPFLPLTAQDTAVETNPAVPVPVLEIEQPKPPVVEVPPASPKPPRVQAQFNRRHREGVKVGADLVVGEGESVSDAVVVYGNAKIDGEVRRDLVVVCGDLTLNGRANGDVVTVFGKVTLGPNAEVAGDLVTVVGEVNSQGDPKIGGDRVEVGSISKFPVIGGALAWARHGLLLGRPLSFEVKWVWVVAAVFFVIHALLQLVLPRPVQSCVVALESRPLSSIFAGLLMMLLLVPVLLLLAVTGIGLILVPFFLCALVLAALLGKVAVYRFVGQQFGKQFGSSFLQAPLLALLIGTAIFYVLYLVPFIGLLSWAVISVIGLGGVLMAASSAFKQEVERNRPTPPPTLGSDPGFGGLAATESLQATGRAGFWIRTCATLLDLVLISLVVALCHVPKIFPLVWGLYHIVLWAWKGTTIGGIILGLRIVRTDGRRVDFAVAFVRAISSVFSALALGIGFFWAGWSRDKQSWHDKIAGTCVVKVAQGQAVV